MKRLELIANRSIQEDLFDRFEKQGIARHYTLLPGVVGCGSSEPKQGDSVWPEENFILIVYCEQEEVERIAVVVRDIKSYFPNEGVKVFMSDASLVV